MKIIFVLGFTAFATVGFLAIDNFGSKSDSFQCDAPTHPDYNALMALYNSTNGDGWKNNSGWGVDCDVCNWHGVSCAEERVTGISLTSNQLIGNLPIEIGALDSLRTLSLPSNTLIGIVPEELKNLQNLEALSLYQNQLEGELRSFVSGLSKLRILRLFNNNLSGTLIDVFHDHANLEELELSSNDFTGELPAEIFQLTNLKSLKLRYCNLEGQIPSTIGNLKELEILEVRDNSLTGTIPITIGNLSKLKTFQIGRNGFTGEIPSELEQMQDLEWLDLSNCFFTGEILSVIDGLEKLKQVSLFRNEFSGSFSSEIGSLTNLETFNISLNNFTGSLPQEFYNLTALRSLNLSRNELSGNIDEKIVQLQNLQVLNLSFNFFEGSIPGGIGMHDKLNLLNLNSNNFSGKIPESFQNLLNLQLLAYDENDISGEFPEFLGFFTKLFHFTAYNNRHTGCIPESYLNYCNINIKNFDENCTFENPNFASFCNGAACNNSLNLHTPSSEVCEGEAFTIESPGGYAQYEWSIPDEVSNTLISEAHTSQYYYITITNTKGCTTTDSIFITVIKDEPGMEEGSICPGGSIEINGEQFTEVGIFDQNIPRPGKCDSIVIVNILQSESTLGDYTDYVCSGDSVEINGTFFPVGNHTQLISNTAGCDSIIDITIYQFPEQSLHLQYSVCEGSTYDFQGQALAAGSHTFTYHSIDGCDSLVNILISENPSSTGIHLSTICPGTKALVNGELFTPGNYTQIITNQFDCDSVINIYIDTFEVYENSLEVEVCEGGSYVFKGQELRGGVHDFTLQSINGCDSIVTITISEIQSHQILVSKEICEGQFVEVGNENFSTSGTYEVLLSNKDGCDSTVTLVLTVIDGEDKEINYSICKGQSYPFAGINYYESVTVADSIIIDGCKSFTTLNLIVHEPKDYEFAVTICEGESFEFFGKALSDSGIYEHTLKSSVGCDSIIEVTLDVQHLQEVFIDTFLCPGSALEFNGEIYSEIGIIKINSVTTNGCDSSIILNIAGYESEKEYFQELVCSGDEVIFNGNSYDAGQYTGIYFNGTCDVEFELTVSEVARIASNHTLAICQGETTDFMGIAYNSGGQYLLNAQVSECETLDYLYVLEASDDLIIKTQVFCSGTDLEVEGTKISESGIYAMPSDMDCSSEYLSVLIIDGTQQTLNQVIKEGQSFEINGFSFRESGTYDIYLGEEFGCFTHIILNLAVETCGGIRNETISMCAGEAIVFLDTMITESGTYEFLKPLQIGCDSVITLMVIVGENLDFVIEGSSYLCQGEETVLSGPDGFEYLWSNGSEKREIIVNSGGIYELIIFDQRNCPSYQEIEIEEISFPAEDIDIYTIDPSTCAVANGVILIDLISAENYSYSIDGGLNFQSDSQFKGLSNGSYEIVLSDTMQRCFKFLSTPVILESKGVPHIQEILVDQINDCKGELGSIKIVPEDSSQSYVFSIDGGENWGNIAHFSDLQAGIYDVRMKLQASECINNLSTKIELSNIGILTAKVKVLSDVSCAETNDGAVELDIIEGAAPYGIKWSNGNTDSTATQLSIGEYTVTISDANGCEEELVFQLTAPSIEENISLFQDSFLCDDTVLEYPVDSIFNYHIFKDDILYYEGKSPTINEAGLYVVIAENGSDCYLEKTFSVDEINPEDLGIDFLLSTEGVKDIDVVIVNISDPMPDNYEWIIENNNVEAIEINSFTQELTFRDTGDYKVSLRSEIGGCITIVDKFISIYPDSSYLGTYEKPDPPLNIDRFNSWEVFPNPNDGLFQVKIEVSSKKMNLHLTIYNIYGAEIESRDLAGNYFYLENFNLSTSGTGIYSVVLRVLEQNVHKNILILK